MRSRSSGKVIAVSLLAAALAFSVFASRGLYVRAAERTAPPASVAVVELFTSEGCSSCPPADELLRRIANTRSDDGQTIIALSEHVTYWNNLGWADRFSSEAFTERQSGYVSRLHVPEAYTPQAVVNGHAQFVGSDARALREALHREAQRPMLQLHIVNVHEKDGALTVEYESADLPQAPRAELWAAITDDEDSSEVARGENTGRTLRHAAVVRALVQVGTISSAGRAAVELRLPAIVTGSPKKPRHVVLLAQLPMQGVIVGAATAAL